ncbi:hypothetical protein Vretimale_11986 [Volvox reticuliferus]|uniref:Sfi1 spindle body domain-containing protein n=1 Tax=Volvox reticuliferus TaxID=1737510 RepID=A0A8J4GHQ2_9CHLO|nr:hypothetical protein Vretifemale_11491 [Volvox reticuliferus]GIM07993.1 hypothetical protein Vretimale_11986 [Volvox reticuliferus]
MQRKLEASVFSIPSCGFAVPAYQSLVSGPFLRQGPAGRATSPSAQDLVQSSGAQPVFAGLRPRPRPAPPNSGQAPSWLPPGASLSKAAAAHRAHRAASVPYQRQRRLAEPRNDKSPSERTLHSRPTLSPHRLPMPPSISTGTTDIAWGVNSHPSGPTAAAQQVPGSPPSQPLSAGFRSPWPHSTSSHPQQLTVLSPILDVQQRANGPSNMPDQRPALATITNTSSNASALAASKGPQSSGQAAPDPSKRLEQFTYNATLEAKKLSRADHMLPQDGQFQPAVPGQHKRQQVQHPHRRYEACCVPDGAARHQQHKRQERSKTEIAMHRQQQHCPDGGPLHLAPWLLTDSYDSAATRAPLARKPSATVGTARSSFMINSLPSPVDALLASLDVSQGENRFMPEQHPKRVQSPEARHAPGQAGLPWAAGLPTPAAVEAGAAQTRLKPVHLNRPVAVRVTPQISGDASPGTYNQNHNDQRQQRHEAWPPDAVRAATRGVKGGASLRLKTVSVPCSSPANQDPLGGGKGTAERRTLQSSPESTGDSGMSATARGFYTSSSVFPSSWLRPVLLHANSAARSDRTLAPALSPRWLEPGTNGSPLPAGLGNTAVATLLQLRHRGREAAGAEPTENATKPPPPSNDPYSPMQKRSQSPPGPGQQHHHDLHHQYHFQRQHQLYQRDRSPEPWAYLFTAATRSPRLQLQPVRAAGGGSEFKSPRPWSSPSPRGLLSTCSVDAIPGAVTAKTSVGRQPAGSPPIPAEWLEGIEELMLMLTPRQSSGAELRPEHRLRPDAMASADVEGRRSPHPRPHSSPPQSPGVMAVAQGLWTTQQLQNQQQTLIQQTQNFGDQLYQQHQYQYHPPNAPEAHALRHVQNQAADARRSPTPTIEGGRQKSQAPLRGEEPRGQGLSKERVRSVGCEQPLRAVSPGRMHPLQQLRSQRVKRSWHAQAQPSTSNGGSTGRLFRRGTHMAVDSTPHGGGDGTSILPWTPPGVAPLGKRRMCPQEEPHAKAQKSPGQPHLMPGQEQVGRGRPQTHNQKCSRTRNNGGYIGVKQHQQQQPQVAQERPAGAGDVQYSSFDASASAVAGRLLREAEQVGLATTIPRDGANGDCGVDGALGDSGSGRAVQSQRGRGHGTALRPVNLGGNLRGDSAAGGSESGGTAADFRPFPLPEWSPAVGGTGAAVDRGIIPDASPRLEAVQEFLGRCGGEPGPRSQARGGLNSPHRRNADTSAPRDLVGIFQNSTARRGTQSHCPGSNSTYSKAVSQPGWMTWAANGQRNNHLQQQPEGEQLLPRCTVAPLPPLRLQMAQRAFAGWRRQVVLGRLCHRIAHRRGQLLQAHVLRAWEDVARARQVHRQGAWATLTSRRLLRLLRKSWLAWRHNHADGLRVARLAAAQYVRSLVARAMRGWITRWAQGASVRVLRRHRAAATMRACLAEWREVTVRLQLEATEEAEAEPQQLEYGRGVHRALRLRNCFRAWLLLTDAAVQVMSQQQALRHVMHDELLNDAALLAAADAIAQHRYLAPTFHAWRVLAAAKTASPATIAPPPPPSTDAGITGGEPAPWIVSSRGPGGPPQTKPLLPMAYATSARRDPAAAPPLPPTQSYLQPPSQSSIIPWVMAGSAKLDPGSAPHHLDPRVSTVAGAEQLADRLRSSRSDGGTSSNNSSRPGSRSSSGGSGRSFEFKCPLPHPQQLYGPDMTPQGEHLSGPRLLSRSWPAPAPTVGSANGGDVVHTSTAAGHDSTTLTAHSQADVAISDPEYVSVTDSGSKAHCSGRSLALGSGAVGFPAVGSGAAVLATADSTPGSDAGSCPGRSQRRSTGGIGIGASMNTPPSVHATRLAQRRSSGGGGLDNPGGSRNSGGSAAAAASSDDELDGGRAVLEELAPEVLFELLESDLAWYTEQYLTPTPENRSKPADRSSSGGGGVALATGPRRETSESYAAPRMVATTATTTTAAAVSTAQIPSRPAAPAGSGDARTETALDVKPVATAVGPAALLPAAAAAASLSMPVQVVSISGTSDPGWGQWGHAGRDSSSNGGGRGAGGADGGGHIWRAANGDPNCRSSRPFQRGEEPQELRMITSSTSAGPGSVSRTQDHVQLQSPSLPPQQQQQQVQPFHVTTNSGTTTQGAPEPLRHRDSKLGRRATPAGRRNGVSTSSCSGFTGASHAVCRGAAGSGVPPFNTSNQWPPMGAYVASPIASDDEEYKQYVALPGETGVLRMRGDSWLPAEQS